MFKSERRAYPLPSTPLFPKNALWRSPMERVSVQRLALFCVAAALAVTLSACSSESAPSAAATPWEGVTLSDLQGNSVQLAPQAGYLTVINVWATWCAPCRRELPSLEKLSKLLDSRHFRVVGVSIDDDPHQVREYLRDKGVTFAELMDPQAQQLERHLDLPTYPATFIVDEGGQIVARVFGERVWHTQDTVQRLERVRAGEGAVF